MNQDHYESLEDIKSKWQPKLHERAGAPTLLGGIDVYHDFDWYHVLGHNRAAFRNGKCLAKEVMDACPPERHPCLLLTARYDVEEGPLSTNDQTYVVVTNIHQYRKHASKNPALGYFAGRSGLNTVAAARRARRRVGDDLELDEILATTISTERLVRWAADNAERVAILEDALTTLNTALAPSDYELPLLQDGVREDSLLPVIRGIMHAAEAGVIKEIAKELTSTPQGRKAASGALSDRLPVRIKDLADAARRFRELLSKPGINEPDLQKHIERTPLLLGLGYAKVLPAHKIPRGQVDFMVRRHDGYHDLLELKRQDHQIVIYNGKDPKHPSSYSLSSELARALAQVHLYREWLAITPDSTMKAQYGVDRVRNPRVTIVIGLRSELPTDEARTILDQLNLTLHTGWKSCHTTCWLAEPKLKRSTWRFSLRPPMATPSDSENRTPEEGREGHG